VVLIPTLASILSFTLLNFNTPVFSYHFGPVNIYSDVYTGGGNSSAPLNEFDPVNKEIFAGETVKWSNPTAGSPYPHIVAFITNQSTELKSKISSITRPLHSSNLQSVISNLNKLLVEEDKRNNKLVNQTFNSRSIVFPSVINSSDHSVIYLNASANRLFNGAEYNMSGDETFVNSGIIWAGGVIPSNFAKINSFIVTFINPATYHYQCLIYPDMKGTIIVKPNPGVLGIQIK
jgi:plastocyanin